MTIQTEKPNTMSRLSRRGALAGLSVTAVAGVAALPGAAAGNSLAIAVPASPAADGELLALKPEFDTLFELWCAMTIEQTAHHEVFEARLREKTGMTRAEAYALDRDSPEFEAYHQTLYAEAKGRGRDNDPASQAWEPVRDRFDELVGDILAHDAATREGLALQARAFISAYSETYDDDDNAGTWNFIASVCAFAGVQFPPVE
jgi:hypothetical protein